ncbi:MAG: lipase family protein [Planctomycetia bacterium]|nr:lipase family protein [Planctomycetia bacterium]
MSIDLKLVEEPLGNPDSARFLCTASELAYLPAAEGERAFAERLRLSARLFSVGNTQGWLAVDDGNIVIAFRGTESPTSLDGLKDILITDAMNLLVVPEGRLGLDLAAAGVGARFHKGFVDAIAAIWEPLSTAVEAEVKRCDRPVWITGHSLGGALALLAAWLLKRKFVPVHEVCTFGAPMIGNRTACEAFNREFQGRIFRYINGRDPVPKLPALSLAANEFVHVDAQRLLGTHPHTGLADVLGTVATKAVNGLLAGTLIDEAWRHVSDEVAAHFLDVYRDLLRG